MKLKLFCIVVIVLSCVISTDLYSGWGGSFRSFDTKTLTEIDSMEIYGAYFSFVVSPDDSLIAVVPAPEADKIIIYERFKIRYPNYGKKVEFNIYDADAMCFSDDNKYLAAPKKDTLYICNLNSGRIDFIKLGLDIKNFIPVNDSICAFTCNDNIIRTFNFNTQKISGIYLLPCNRFVITKDLKNIIYTDYETFASVKISDGNTNWLYRNLSLVDETYSYRVSSDGNFLAFSNNRNTLAIYTLPELKKIFEKNINCYYEFSRDNKCLTYSNSTDGCKNIRLDDLLETEYKGINDYKVRSFKYSTSGKYLIYSNNDSTLFYNLKTESYERIIINTGYMFSIISDDDKFACFINTNYPSYKFKIYSFDKDKFISDFAFDHSDYDFREVRCFSKDNKFIYITGSNIYELDFIKGVIKDSIAIPKSLFSIGSFIKERFVFCHSRDYIFTIWDLITGKSLEFHDHGSTVKKYIFISDKNQLLIEYSDKTRILYAFPDSINDDTKLKVIWKIYGLPSWLYLSPSNKYLATHNRFYGNTFDAGYSLWDTETGRHLYRQDENLYPWSNFGFTSDDSKVFSSVITDSSYVYFLDVSELDIKSGKIKNTHMPGMRAECDFCWSYFTPSGNYFIRRNLELPDPPTDIKEMDASKKINSDIFIFPNPATDYIEISHPSESFKLSEGLSVRIYSVFGQEVYPTPALPVVEGVSSSQYSAMIDVSGLPPGLYFVRVGEKVGKFLKI